MFHVILYQPEIPPNTGNIIRLCANTGAQLHLIEPLGFRLTDARLRRAGLDYHDHARLATWTGWADFVEHAGVEKVWALTTRGSNCHADVSFHDGDGLLFGPESRGLPDDLLEALGAARQLRIPMCPDSRSLNLSNSVAIVLFEAWRQVGFAGGA